MKVQLFCVLILFAGAGWCDELAGSSLVLREKGSSVVSGRVYDDDTGVGIAGVELSIRGVQTTKTDADGYYWFTELLANRWEIVCQDVPGYVLKKEYFRKVARIKEDGLSREIDFALPRAVQVRGRVLDPNGNPLPYLPLVARWPGEEITATSALDGSFVLDGFAPWATFSIASAEPGYVVDYLAEHEVPQEGLNGLVVNTFASCEFSGRVLDSSGLPLQNARVIWQIYAPHGTRSGLSESTAENGTFQIPELLAGSYVFAIRPFEGRTRRIMRHTFEPGEKIDDVTMIYDPSAGLKIRGQVTDTEGNPLEGVYFAAMGATMHSSTRTDAGGNFVVHDLDEGTYGLTGLTYRGREHTGGVKAEAGESGVTIVLDPLPERVSNGPVRGRVVDAGTGQPVARFEYLLKRGVTMELDLEWRGPEGERLTGILDLGSQSSSWRRVQKSDGAFNIRTYATGAHSLAIRAEGYGFFYGRVEAPSDGVEIALEPEARVEGIVRDPTGAAVKDAWIVYGEADWLEAGEPHRQPLTRTDRDGWFLVGGLRSEVGKLAVWHEDWGTKSLELQLVSGTTSRTEVFMSAAGSIAGYVYLDGESIRDVSINVRASDSGDIVSAGIGKICMDGADRYALNRIPPGDYEIIVRMDPFGYQPGPKLEATALATVVAGQRTEVVFEFDSTEALAETPPSD